MEQIWVAALSINLTLVIWFACCVRMFNCCMRYSTVVRDLYVGGLTTYSDAPLAPEDNSNDGGYSKLSIHKRMNYVNDALLNESRRLWQPRTPMAVIAVLSLIIDSSAQAVYSFANTPIDTNGDNLTWAEWLVFFMNHSSKMLMLSTPSIPYQVSYGICVGLGFVALPLGVYIQAMDRRDNDFSHILFQILASMFVFPVCSTLFSILSCEYPKHGSPVLTRDTHILCWEEYHSGLVALAQSAFVCYYFICTLTTARVVRAVLDEAQLVAREGPSALYFRPRFTVWYFQLRVIASFLATYWSSSSYPRLIVPVGVFVITSSMQVYTVYARPCNADVHNILRIYSLTLPLLFEICAILSQSISRWNVIGQWFMLAFGTLWLVCVVFHYIREFGCECCFSARTREVVGFSDLSNNNGGPLPSMLRAPLVRALPRASEALPGAFLADASYYGSNMVPQDERQNNQASRQSALTAVARSGSTSSSVAVPTIIRTGPLVVAPVAQLYTGNSPLLPRDVPHNALLSDNQDSRHSLNTRIESQSEGFVDCPEVMFKSQSRYYEDQYVTPSSSAIDLFQA